MENISTCCFETVPYSNTPSLRLNGVEDADEPQPSLAASERIP